MFMTNFKVFLTMYHPKVKKILLSEKGEVNIVAIVVLIGIAVLLALVFKDNIQKLLESLFKTITSKATSAVEG